MTAPGSTVLHDRVARSPGFKSAENTVSVNGTVIPHADIARETQHHPADCPTTAWTAATRALVVRQLLLQEARRLNIAAAPETDADGRQETEEDAAIRALLDREVRTPQADDATCRRYFDRNQGRFRSPDLYEAAHILLSAARDDPAARSMAIVRARELIAALLRHPEQFADFARAESACPSRNEGGCLGQIGPGQTVPEFETALRAMTPGQIHPEPVPSGYGVHVVRLDRRLDGQFLPFEAVGTRIAIYLNHRAWHRAMHQYLCILAGRAEIRGVELPTATSPLVQ